MGNMARTSKLTPRQERFVQEYLIDLNATQASIRAGYSAKGATVRGAELLANRKVQEAVEKAKAHRSERTCITQDRVLQELSRIAFFDPRKLFTDAGDPIDIHDLDDDVAAVLAGLDIVVERTDEGRDGFTSVRKYKLTNKLGALEAAMRHLGMFKDSLELKGGIAVTISQDDAKL